MKITTGIVVATNEITGSQGKRKGAKDQVLECFKRGNMILVLDHDDLEEIFNWSGISDVLQEIHGYV